MNAVVDFTNARYAVIEGFRTEAGHEHLVIAYPSEKSLRDLFAAPSIVALGFTTRHEALIAGGADFPTAEAQQREENTTEVPETGRSPQSLTWTGPRAEASSVLLRLGSFLVTSCSAVAISAIILFSSGNRLSAALRMALGSSL
ncbi:MAG: hypothetical protein WBV55_03320 [Candidatus Sulfotelmatobacter sp.]